MVHDGDDRGPDAVMQVRHEKAFPVLKKVCLDEGDRRAEVKEMMMKLEDVVRMYSRWAFQTQISKFRILGK
jgi:hypothetical protein